MSTKFRSLVDEGWKRRTERLGEEDLKAEGERLLAEVNLIRGEHGGSLESVSGEQSKRVKTILGQLDILGELKDQPTTGYTPLAAREDSPLATPGWKAGHWSGPLLKRLGDTGGTKDLAPNGSVTVPSLTGGIVPIDDRPQRLLDVIPSGAPLVDTNQFAYLREIKREHKAAETAPGALKPTSAYQVEKIEDTAKTIAHLSEPIKRQDLEDAQLLRQYIDMSLRAGVLLRLDSQVLGGNGEGENLTGLNATEGVQDQEFATDILTTARKALTLLEDAEIPGGVYVLSTAVWEALELTTAEGSGEYVLGKSSTVPPVDRAQRRLWGQPVIVTTALNGIEVGEKPAGFLVDFMGSTKIWEREKVRIDWSEAPEGSVEDEAAFKTNEIVFRGEGRFGFGVLRPEGVIRFPTEE